MQRFENFGPFGTPASLPSTTEASGKKVFTSIPIIDLSALCSDDATRRISLAKDVFTACHDVGFFQATGHGIDQDEIETALSQIKQFFALSTDEKLEVHFHKNQFYRGYEALFDTRHEAWGKGGMFAGFSSVPLIMLPKRITVVNSGNRYERGFFIFQ